MHLIDISPRVFLLRGHVLTSLGVTEVTLSSPIRMLAIGESTMEGHRSQLYVEGAKGPEALYHIGDAPPVACDPTKTPGQVVATMFPGLTIHQRLADGSFETLVNIGTRPAGPPTPAEPKPPGWPPATLPAPFASTAEEMAAMGLIDQLDPPPENVDNFLGEGTGGVTIDVDLNAPAPEGDTVDEEF